MSNNTPFHHSFSNLSALFCHVMTTPNIPHFVNLPNIYIIRNIKSHNQGVWYWFAVYLFGNFSFKADKAGQPMNKARQNMTKKWRQKVMLVHIDMGLYFWSLCPLPHTPYHPSSLYRYIYYSSEGFTMV